MMTDHSVKFQPEMDNALLDQADRLMVALSDARDAIGRIVFGQEAVVEHLLTAILSGGHALLLGAPGLGKTLLVSTVARIFGLDTKRIQFTPDLMPSDITGSEILEESKMGTRGFRFIPGPIFTQMLLADEINRASPRTQSALLQAMQEYRVTQSGMEHALPRPFHVLATQNPLDMEGTYPLPEAQLDRFMLSIPLTYPHAEAEKRMLIATTGVEETEIDPLFSADSLRAAQHLVRSLPVGEKIMDAIIQLMRDLRPETSRLSEMKHLAYGPGPRAAQALMLTCRARALMTGRLSPNIADIEALASVALSHRMGLKFTAESASVTINSVIANALKRLA